MNKECESWICYKAKLKVNKFKFGPSGMTLNQKKESDIILEKKNTLMQLWISMKQSIFDVLFVVLDKAVA